MDGKTVQDLLDETRHSKIWLCPDQSSHSAFRQHPLLQGLECAKSTVPEELKSKIVVKHFVEDHFLCIIWHNDGTLVIEEDPE